MISARNRIVAETSTINDKSTNIIQRRVGNNTNQQNCCTTIVIRRKQLKRKGFWIYRCCLLFIHFYYQQHRMVAVLGLVVKSVIQKRSSVNKTFFYLPTTSTTKLDRLQVLVPDTATVIVTSKTTLSLFSSKATSSSSILPQQQQQQQQQDQPQQQQRLMSNAIVPTEVIFDCIDGMKIAAQSWQTSSVTTTTATTANNEQQEQLHEDVGGEERILCLHGWMDNCRSFYKLAPEIIHHYSTTKKRCHLVAMDIPGHGLSSHKGIDAPPSLLAESVFYVHDVISQMQWDGGPPVNSHNNGAGSNGTTLSSSMTRKMEPFTIIGHSMGTGIACLYAAAFPEHVKKLILLEGVGPFPRNAQDTGIHLRQHIVRRRLGLEQHMSSKNNNNNNSRKQPRIYETIAHAVQARQATAKQFPGKQYISYAGAYEMVVRGTKPVRIQQPSKDSTTTGSTGGDGDGDGDGGVQFVHDPRLQWPSIQYLTQEQVDGLYYNIQCPTGILLGVDGWPYTVESYQRTIRLLKPVLVRKLPGSHHFHLDPDTCEQVAKDVITFLSSSC